MISNNFFVQYNKLPVIERVSGELWKECTDHCGNGTRFSGQIESASAEKEESHGHVQSHVRAVRDGGKFRTDSRSQKPDQPDDFKISSSGHDDSE
jgi:hypothetical protein